MLEQTLLYNDILGKRIDMDSSTVHLRIERYSMLDKDTFRPHANIFVCLFMERSNLSALGRMDRECCKGIFIFS